MKLDGMNPAPPVTKTRFATRPQVTCFTDIGTACGADTRIAGFARDPPAMSNQPARRQPRDLEPIPLRLGVSIRTPAGNLLPRLRVALWPEISSKAPSEW